MKRQSGITLIALIVTIIILLILAGISISMVLGKNGILNKAENSVARYIVAEQEEQEQLQNLADYIEKYASYETGTNENKSKSIEIITLEESQEKLVDGNWVTWKDINTRTSRVNVYLESIYYKPEFNEFFARKFAINTVKQIGINFYDSVDGIDFAIDTMMAPQVGMTRAEMEKEYGVIGMNELERSLTFEFSYLDPSEFTEEMTEEEQKTLIKTRIEEIQNELGDESPFINLLETYNQIVNEYDQLYGNVGEMTTEEKEKTYEITLPNGRLETLSGEQLTKYRIRYSINNNGQYQFVINNENEENLKGINVKIGNIGNYWEEIGDYIYTYNCVSKYPIMTYSDWTKTEKEWGIKATDYRLNLGGWNVSRKDSTESVEELFLNQVNGENVTAMIGTFSKCSFSEDIYIEIPKTIKTMLFSFYDTDLMNAPIIPASVEYMRDIFNDSKNITSVAFEKAEGEIWDAHMATSHYVKRIFLLDESTATVDYNAEINRWHYDINNEFAETEAIYFENEKIYLRNVGSTTYNNDIEDAVYLKIEDQSFVDITECVSADKKYINLQTILDKGFVTEKKEYNVTIKISKPNGEEVVWEGTINF